jgi:hypothetical protein
VETWSSEIPSLSRERPPRVRSRSIEDPFHLKVTGA